MKSALPHSTSLPPRAPPKTFATFPPKAASSRGAQHGAAIMRRDVSPPDCFVTLLTFVTTIKAELILRRPKAFLGFKLRWKLESKFRLYPETSAKGETRATLGYCTAFREKLGCRSCETLWGIPAPGRDCNRRLHQRLFQSTPPTLGTRLEKPARLGI